MITMNCFNREEGDLRNKETNAFQRVVQSGWWILGNEVKHFEQIWAQHCGVAHAVGVANGMDALEIGLRALGIGLGDEVITTPMTAFASVLAILRTGATPVFADIETGTAHLCPESAQRCITSRTKAILIVHLYGQAMPMNIWEKLCLQNRVMLLEDCAQAHGARWMGKSVGSFGKYAGWSFYPTKNLGTLGDGGALTTNDLEIAQKARMLRNYGQSERYVHPVEGLNSRLDELHAAILSERLCYLDQWNQRRKTHADFYWSHIKNPHIELLQKPRDSQSHVNHLFVLRALHRESLKRHLQQCGIESLSHYPIPVHMQKPCYDLPRDPKGLSVAEMHAAQCLSIPCHPHLTDEERQQVVDALNSFGP